MELNPWETTPLLDCYWVGSLDNKTFWLKSRSKVGFPLNTQKVKLVAGAALQHPRQLPPARAPPSPRRFAAASMAPNPSASFETSEGRRPPATCCAGFLDTASPFELFHHHFCLGRFVLVNTKMLSWLPSLFFRAFLSREVRQRWSSTW